MALLIVGASGFVGRHAARRALALGITVVGTYATAPAEIEGVDWRRLDITDSGGVSELVESVRPAAVISTAYAAQPTLASRAANWMPNAVGAVTVAQAAHAVGARLVHVSTDALHSGRPDVIGDTEPPSPTSPYGAAKAAAELAIATIFPSAAMPRLSLVNSDGTDGAELSRRERFMVDLASGRATGVLFTDDVRRPIAVTDVASALLELALGTDGGGTDASGRHAGPINLAGSDDASFYDLGVLVAGRHGLDPGAIVATTIVAARVARPGIVRLDPSLAATILNTRLRGIRELLAGPAVCEPWG